MIKTTLLAFGLATFTALGSSLWLSDLRCEYRNDPIGIDTLRPRLSWVVHGRARGVLQSAYQVIVASSPDLLKKNQGDLWDSGRIDSDASIQVSYRGQPPASVQACFWKVRIWDQNGNVSGWSKPARWTMGLLGATDWKAKWIGFTPPPDRLRDQLKEQLSLRDNDWVWAHGASSVDQPPGKVFLRRLIRIPANRPVADAKFVMTADDRARLFVNGHAAGPTHADARQLAIRDVAAWLRAGTNVLAIEAENAGSSSNPAGMVGRLGVVFADGQAMSVPVDHSWMSSSAAAPGWTAANFDDTGWKPAAEVLRFGEQPWGKIVRYPMRPAPYFRKAFAINKPVRRAIVFASALGAYELHLNGRPVDNDVLSPGWTDFKKRVHYFGYDVTTRIHRGTNVLGAILGDGWYASYLAFTGRRYYYGGHRRLIVQLQLEYRDGSRQVIGTDATWKTAEGPIRRDDLLMGSVYDARAEWPGWDAAQFDDHKWIPARVDSAVKTPLVAHPGEPIRRAEEIRAQHVTEPAPGVYVFDLGQNMVGWARVRVKGVAGTRVRVRYAEMLNSDGTLYTANLRRAKATDFYYLAGGSKKRAYEPWFTFHGFRYVEVSGLDYKPALSDVVGIVVHSDLKRTGWFQCSNPLVNRLALNSLWSQKGNFLDVPTDCPQRDERAGWTGDAQVFMKTACFNMDAPAFYTKWLVDLCDDSQLPDGGFCDVAPPLAVVGHGNTGWSDAGPICNWRLYEMYGDTRALRLHYPALVRYADYLWNTSTNFTRGCGAYGDWLRLAGPQYSDAIGTAYYFYTIRTMAGIAAALGRRADADHYRKLAQDIRSVFVSKFIRTDGQIVDEKNQTSQTFYALAFGLGLVPQAMKARVAGQFVALLRQENDHIATGFLGTPFILFALEKSGHPELAYKLLLNRTYPSWLQQVLWGATTMWERWDGWRPDKGFEDPGMNSFNHYWLGCVNEWLFTRVAGIDTDGPGFKRIIIQPVIVKPADGLSWVKASYDSIRGTIRSQWKLENGRLRLQVTIPGNSTARVYVPAMAVSDVTEQGRAVDKAAAVKFLRMENGCAVFQIGSGRFDFLSRSPRLGASE